jgi:hypothetical protein
MLEAPVAAKSLQAGRYLRRSPLHSDVERLSKVKTLSILRFQIPDLRKQLHQLGLVAFGVRISRLSAQRTEQLGCDEGLVWSVI